MCQVDVNAFTRNTSMVGASSTDDGDSPPFSILFGPCQDPGRSPVTPRRKAGGATAGRPGNSKLSAAAEYGNICLCIVMPELESVPLAMAPECSPSPFSA